jgi:Carboxypeptidase regulatory-like domain
LLGSDGKPLSGALVTLTGDPDDGRVPLASTKTSTTGSFRIEQVRAGGYQIHARASGHVESVARIAVELPDGARVELKLKATVVLAGHIEDGRGTRVPLARVLAFAVAEAASPVLHETRADERGAFRLVGLAPGAHRLLIEAPGLGTASAGPVRAPDETVVVVLSGEIRAIVGRVTRAGQPVPGARVLLGGESVADPRSSDTDGEGRFAFGGLGPGSYALRAEAGGWVAPVLTDVVVDRALSQTRKVDLPLAPGTFASGRVVGEDGQAVVRAAVQIDLVPATGLWPEVLTDATGNWHSAPLGPGSYRVRAHLVGFVARRTVTVQIARGDAARPPAPMLLELVRTGEISGRVVDDRGGALAGATVHDRLAETEELGVIWSRLPPAAEAAALPNGAVFPSASVGPGISRRAITDASGKFLLGGVPPGRLRLEVLNPASVPLRTDPMTLAPGARLEVGTLHVRGAIQVAGRVLDSDGQPLGGVRIAAARLSSPADASAGLYAVTGSDGSFSLPLSAGEHHLTAAVNGRPDIEATVRVPESGAPPAPLVLRFSKPSQLTVEGVVRDTEKRPLARARISARALADTPTPGGALNAGSNLFTTTADAGGSFRLTGLPPGRLSLGIEHDGYAPHQQIVDPGALSAGTPISVEVPVPGGIDGEVHERITGAPVPGFQIDAHGPDGGRARFPDVGKSRRHTLGPLRFSLRRLAPGHWTLRVRAPGYAPVDHAVEVASASTPGEASLRDLRLELDRER